MKKPRQLAAGLFIMNSIFQAQRTGIEVLAQDSDISLVE